MSLVGAQQRPERRPPPAGLDLGLQSPSINNPFRKSPVSPSFAPTLSSPVSSAPTERPTSNNPFLDNPAVRSGPAESLFPLQKHQRNDLNAEHLLDRLTLTDSPPLASARTTRAPRSENVPPPLNGPSGNVLAQSQEGRARARTNGKPRGAAHNPDIFADPQDASKSQRKPRRNSDSSIIDKKTSPEEERKRRERRAREKGRDIKSGTSSSSGRPKKPSHRLDVIDKLDVTSIYGMGLFHHDGPFDACNPHRNRKGSSRAPMSAFPKDSANNTLGGSGPINKTINLAQFHGHTADGFTDYSSSGVGSSNLSSRQEYEPYAGTSAPTRENRNSNFNPTRLVDVVHGPETSGLGTTTFLEGAPAARVAIERRESEGEVGGLSRKRSFAQKIRGINNARVGPRVNAAQSPEPRHEHTTSLDGGVQSAGGLPKINETNPFFNSDDAYEKKGVKIRAAEAQDSSAVGGEPGNARMGLERSVTEGNDLRSRQLPPPTDENKNAAGSFMNRVRSLRGGGRGKPRGERKE